MSNLVNVRTLRFRYADLKWPAAFAEVELSLIGQSRDRTSPFSSDFSIWKGQSDQFGAVNLRDSSSKLDGMIAIAEKKNSKLLGLSRMNIIGDLYVPDYIVKLLRLRITDRAPSDGENTQEFLPTRESFTLNWDRQPVAGFDGLEFSDVADFLDYLQMRFSYLRTYPLDRLALRLVRAGSPPPRSSLILPLGSLRDMLQTTDFDPTDKWGADRLKRYTAKKAGIAQKVAAEVAAQIPAARRPKKLLDVFETGLKELATFARSMGPPVSWAPLSFPAGPSGRLLALASGVSRAFDYPQTGVSQESGPEQLAGIGIIVFLAGAIALGYKWGSFEYSGDSTGNDITDITISNTSACSEDDFMPYCHLIRP